MTENPHQSPASRSSEPPNPDKEVSPVRAAYNAITDTVAGPNVRWSDNLFQAVFVLVSMAAAALLGAILAAVNASWELPWYGGAMLGAFAGLFLGVITSGVYLMIYRAGRHMRGKHD